MNRTVLAMLAVVALSGCRQAPATTTTPPAFSADDESAVRALVNEFANTWNRHDMKAMHELNTGDVEWVNVTANHWQGNPAVFKGVLHAQGRIPTPDVRLPLMNASDEAVAASLAAVNAAS